MTHDPFDAYKLPVALAESIDISLDGTPAVFTVMLPSRLNEDFTMKLLSRLTGKNRAAGELSPIEIQVERKKLFLSENVLSATGLPGGMDTAGFFLAYPLAAKALFERAQELTVAADEEVEAALEKLSGSQNGKRSGADGPSNTKTLSPQASNQKPQNQTSAA